MTTRCPLRYVPVVAVGAFALARVLDLRSPSEQFLALHLAPAYQAIYVALAVLCVVAVATRLAKWPLVLSGALGTTVFATFGWDVIWINGWDGVGPALPYILAAILALWAWIGVMSQEVECRR